MNKIYKILLLSFIIIGFNSCDENENFEILPQEGGISINSPIDGSSISLIGDNETNPALTISWTAPLLEGTGVTYKVEAALTGTDFAKPILIGTTTKTTISMTVKELNTFAHDVLLIKGDTETAIDIRVISDNEVSKKISVILTPYKVEFTEFYLVGSLTEWDPTKSLPMTRIGFNEFEITIDLKANDEFKFLPTNIDWTGDWGEDPANPGTLIDKNEQNLKGYTAGKYKIYINLNTFTFKVTPLIAPTNLFLVGSLTGWDPTTSLPFFKSAENVFTIVINLPAGAEFKFLPTNTGWDGDWGANKDVSGGIVQDNEDNVKGFAAGKYLVTVDFNTLTYKLTSINNLFLVGSLTGWDPGTSLPMSEASLGIFSKVIDLPAGAEFKFLPTNSGWDGDWGGSKDISGRIVQENEDNIKGFEAGKYVIAVNFNTLSYTVSKLNAVPFNLYLVGGFNGWNNSAFNPQFTNPSTGVFNIIQTLAANDEFKFVPVAGSWGDDFGESKTSKNVLEQNNEQNLKVTENGSYSITVDFNKGNISVVKQ